MCVGSPAGPPSSSLTSREIAMNHRLTQAIERWRHVEPVVKYPENEKELDDLISDLDELLEIVGSDENHPLIGLVNVLSLLIEAYEEEHFKNQQPVVKNVNVLKFLMDQHGLKQSDLSEIGSQGVVSEILRGKRKLSLKQITLLANRFNVDVSIFIDD
jgi:HTH-type transcriptional regulator/antitoxin HigA